MERYATFFSSLSLDCDFFSKIALTPAVNSPISSVIHSISWRKGFFYPFFLFFIFFPFSFSLSCQKKNKQGSSSLFTFVLLPFLSLQSFSLGYHRLQDAFFTSFILATPQVRNSVIKRRIRLRVCVTASSSASVLLSGSSDGFILTLHIA